MIDTIGTRILAIEDDADTQANLRDILELDGYDVEVAGLVKDALNRSDWEEYTAIILDRRLPDGTAEDLMPQLNELAPDAAVIVVTGHADFDSSVTALRHGAVDYILKPIDANALRGTIARIVRLREAERRAEQAERLAAIGEMMTVLSHESRNAFQLSAANMEMLERRLDHDRESLVLLKRIEKHQERICQLFEDVRSYAAPITLDRRVWDLSKIMQGEWDQVVSLSPERDVRLQLRSPESLGGQHLEPICKVDSFRIEQVFRNLFENSLAACSDPVHVAVDWSAAELHDQPAVKLSVHDNGPGLSPEQKQKVFEPFFTTKSKGTGLGMAISKRIVEAHGGHIDVVNNGHSGAEFQIVVPRAINGGVQT